MQQLAGLAGVTAKKEGCLKTLSQWLTLQQPLFSFSTLTHNKWAC